MSYNPGVSFFIDFHQLDPSRQRQCIFFTQKGKRCAWDCQASDNERAILLRHAIDAISVGIVSLDLLQEYILCNCCRSGRARHRDRIEDIHLLLPLAQRWQEEIRGYANWSTSISRPNGGVVPIGAVSALAGNSDVSDTVIADQSRYQMRQFTTSDKFEIAPRLVASPPVIQHSSSEDLDETGVVSFPLATHPRYDFRYRIPESIIASNFVQPALIIQPPLSEFRAHIAEPTRNDSVYEKLLEPLENRDFETGSLYMFNRESSPGHVKLGWTARTVQERLENWANCGYTPNLLFELNHVPHAQRVETLTHHELIKEWRRERMCQAPWCRKSHQEWFEIEIEKAEQVSSDWAKFMQRVKPYDVYGVLREQWRAAIKKIDKEGEVVTAKKLLEVYEQSLTKEISLLEERSKIQIGLKQELKEEGHEHESKMKSFSQQLDKPAQPSKFQPDENDIAALVKAIFKAEISPKPFLLSDAPPETKPPIAVDPVPEETKSIVTIPNDQSSSFKQTLSAVSLSSPTTKFSASSSSPQEQNQLQVSVPERPPDAVESTSKSKHSPHTSVVDTTANPDSDTKHEQSILQSTLTQKNNTELPPPNQESSDTSALIKLEPGTNDNTKDERSNPTNTALPPRPEPAIMQSIEDLSADIAALTMNPVTEEWKVLRRPSMSHLRWWRRLKPRSRRRGVLFIRYSSGKNSTNQGVQIANT